jgi:hypothetical protein
MLGSTVRRQRSKRSAQKPVVQRTAVIAGGLSLACGRSGEADVVAAADGGSAAVEEEGARSLQTIARMTVEKGRLSKIPQLANSVILRFSQGFRAFKYLPRYRSTADRSMK